MKSKFATLLAVVVLLAASLACGTQSTGGTDQPAAGPCYNVLFPFVPGNQWIYQISAEDGSEPSKLGLTVEKVEDSRAFINALDMSTGVITQTVAECDDGAITNFPALTQTMLIGNAAASEFSLEYVAGVFAPAESAFTGNDWLYNWTSDFIATGSIQVQDEGETMTIVLQDSPVHLAWQTAGSGDAAFETVTVPAGTFDRALKIQRVMTMNISLVVEGMSVSGTLTLRTTQWFEPFTGLLKSQIDSGDVTYMGLIFPISVKSTVELVEFRSGQ
ncbi:MAG: hypothetical protein FD146_1304 [Anaerolineaceae bacterium]|nr:MAG: hypothetical protein FD146_1304 [Anaerolineaceae bacterium]